MSERDFHSSGTTINVVLHHVYMYVYMYVYVTHVTAYLSDAIIYYQYCVRCEA